MTRAALINIDFDKVNLSDSQKEILLLSTSAGAIPIFSFVVKRYRPDSRLFIGIGKVKEIKQILLSKSVELVIFNHTLTPSQQRNLETMLQCRVIDRVSLILDIFSLHAKSSESKLQVELAQLRYLSTRLVHAWTHLERQKGGIGLRGPGETQLETDRRLLRKRIKYLTKRQCRLVQQRETQRRLRERSKVFTISIVGYTNTGKSTLFNALTKANSCVADQPFSTLGTMSRRTYLKDIVNNVIISDTIGFIKDLPHQLVTAFRATLEETKFSDLLLHVIDSSNTLYEAQIMEVEKVLDDLGIRNVPRIMIWNKIDITPTLLNRPTIERDEHGRISRVFISALSGCGLEELRCAIAEAISV